MKQHYLKMLQYEHWANSRMIEMVKSLPSENITEKVKAIFSHILAAERIWYSRISNQECPFKVWEVAPVEVWQDRLDENIKLLSQLVESFQDDDYARLIEYKNSFGLAYTNPIGEIFNHFPMHSAYHRGQIVILLREKLEKVPLFDYIQYAREVL